jgi:tRNA (guanine-N7-)-methyltransferase
VGEDRSRGPAEAGVLTPLSEADPAHRRRHYGRRKGWKLRPHQAELLGSLLPQLTLAPEPGRDPRSYFDAPLGDVWLEIGFGAGEHLAWQAEHNPAVGLIGAEPFVAGMAKLLSKIEQSHLTNVRLYTEDARDVLTVLPDASLGRIFILFPDPWPKTRHHKRRFIQMAMLDELARVLRPGGELRFASDHAGYVAHALECFLAHASFRWLADSAADWRQRPADWPETRYEAKAIAAARACTYLRLVRV